MKTHPTRRAILAGSSAAPLAALFAITPAAVIVSAGTADAATRLRDFHDLAKRLGQLEDATDEARADFNARHGASPNADRPMPPADPQEERRLLADPAAWEERRHRLNAERGPGEARWWAAFMAHPVHRAEAAEIDASGDLYRLTDAIIDEPATDPATIAAKLEVARWHLERWADPRRESGDPVAVMLAKILDQLRGGRAVSSSTPGAERQC